MTRVDRGRARAALALVALAGLVAACGPDEPKPAAPTGPPPAPGYSRVIGNGFSLDLPSTWQQPALDPAAFEQTAAALRDKNPQLAQALESFRSAGGAENRLFAFDPIEGSSVNLVVTSMGGRTLDQLVAQAVEALRSLGATAVMEERTTLSGSPAARVQFDLPVRGEAGEVAVPEAQYYVPRSDRLFILTLFGASPSLSAIVESLRFS